MKINKEKYQKEYLSIMNLKLKSLLSDINTSFYNNPLINSNNFKDKSKNIFSNKGFESIHSNNNIILNNLLYLYNDNLFKEFDKNKINRSKFVLVTKINGKDSQYFNFIHFLNKSEKIIQNHYFNPIYYKNNIQTQNYNSLLKIRKINNRDNYYFNMFF